VSRRHHGRSRHARGRSDDGPRLQAQIEPRPETRRDPPVEPRPDATVVDAAAQNGTVPDERVSGLPAAVPHIAPIAAAPHAAVPQATVNAQAAPVNPQAAQVNGNGHAPHPHDPTDMNGGQRAGCTAPQLRRFIKSRPYVPMHELRRRFGINGAEDEVSALPLEDARVYVGLPERECRLLGELVRGGEVGYELSLDPRTPIVVGVYPMRPVPRA
jgi:hypothetical protein